MTFTITFGYWLIPTFITILGYGTAIYFGTDDDPFVGSLFALLGIGAATIVSLISWLIYFMVF
jgi:hypothetical protein